MASKPFISPQMSHSINEQGILVVRVLSGDDTSTLAAANRSVAILRELSSGTRRPLLVDLTSAKDLAPEARQLYIDCAPEYATRLALVSKSVLTRIVGNFFIAIMAIGKNPLPAHLFENEEEAVAWLLK